MADSPRIPPAVVAKRFACDELEFVGRGGQSDVWRAVRDGAEEVLRILVAVNDPRRVEHEVSALQAIDNPHLMAFYGLGEIAHNGKRHPVIRGEFIRGGTAADRIDSDEWPDVRGALCLARGTLTALAALHEADLVHRDIKPGNIALRDGDWDSAVVLDLGYVRNLAAPPITVYPQRIGTVPFMAPEQLMLQPAALRSDVYAVGIVLYLLLTRRHPFLDGDEEIPLDEYLGRMDSPDWPRWDDVPHADLVGPLLAWNPHARPRSRRALADFEEVLA